MRTEEHRSLLGHHGGKWTSRSRPFRGERQGESKWESERVHGAAESQMQLCLEPAVVLDCSSVQVQWSKISVLGIRAVMMPMPACRL